MDILRQKLNHVGLSAANHSHTPYFLHNWRKRKNLNRAAVCSELKGLLELVAFLIVLSSAGTFLAQAIDAYRDYLRKLNDY